ncbi:MAG: hypothetical protein JWM47_4448, partial [Acidimicrobiales bacterium]|nr:hypothetical protein [Acidimicrobiales bacterium]
MAKRDREREVWEYICLESGFESQG